MHGTTRPRLVVGVVTALALTASGCGGNGEVAEAPADTTADTAAAPTTDPVADPTTDAAADPTTDPASDEETAAGPDDEAAASTVAVAASSLGDVLVDGDGRTLYVFVPDEGGEPTCTGGCAEAWPPVAGPATAGDGADEALLSTASHPSGVTQVTYGGWPLYLFANDAAPGDVNGQGVNDVWFVLGPDGEPIRDGAGGADEED